MIQAFRRNVSRVSLGGVAETSTSMNRPLILFLVAAAGLAGCSVQDVRQTAENVRIRAEGIGAQAEAERSDRLIAQGGGTAYREVPQEDSLQQPAEPGTAETPAGAPAAAAAPAPPPPQPVYVIVPGN